MTATHTKPPAANPQRPDEDKPDTSSKVDEDKPDTSSKVKVDEQPEAPGLYVIVATPREGAQLVELHTAETAEARVSLLTWGSRQHRKQAEEEGVDVPEGGGTHEINRSDVKVYKLNTSEVTDF